MSIDRRRIILVETSNFDTLFLDRDGVINKKLEGKYVRNWEEFEFIPNVLSSISKLSNLFNRIIIITNQQGIRKGLMSENDLLFLHQKMLNEIEKAGGKINKIYFCPHLETDNCNCRKPKIGMIEKAIQDFPSINIKKSYLIGDSPSDIEAGKRAGLHTIKVDNNFTLNNWVKQILAY
jgi:D-glycero-D-manno-heptose 1,7-bisphosphate phosphatase